MQVQRANHHLQNRQRFDTMLHCHASGMLDEGWGEVLLEPGYEEELSGQVSARVQSLPDRDEHLRLQVSVVQRRGIRRRSQKQLRKRRHRLQIKYRQQRGQSIHLLRQPRVRSSRGGAEDVVGRLVGHSRRPLALVSRHERHELCRVVRVCRHLLRAHIKIHLKALIELNMFARFFKWIKKEHLKICVVLSNWIKLAEHPLLKLWQIRDTEYWKIMLAQSLNVIVLTKMKLKNGKKNYFVRFKNVTYTIGYTGCWY